METQQAKTIQPAVIIQIFFPVLFMFYPLCLWENYIIGYINKALKYPIIYDILYMFAFFFDKYFFNSLIYLIAIEIKEYYLLAIFILTSLN